jgi:hypothetical protein
MLCRTLEVSLHWLSMAGFPKDLRGHVARGSTGCRQDMELLFIHDPRQSKIRNEKVCVILWCSE